MRRRYGFGAQPMCCEGEDEMGKALILWLLGVPGIIVLLLYFFVFR